MERTALDVLHDGLEELDLHVRNLSEIRGKQIDVIVNWLKELDKRVTDLEKRQG